MAEVRAVPLCGLKAVSTFSGCGGSSLGYRMAGFEVLWASEFVPAARDTYRANFPSTIVDERDIRQVRPEDILEAIGMRRGQLDLLDGSPPCAAFSTSGRREAGWGEVRKYSDRKQRVDDLFFEYARILEGLQPKAFVAENVSGLVKGVAKGYFKEILTALRACGYRVGARVLDAQWLGVPQTRARLIFVGFREDLGIDPVHPTPLPYRYSLREAFDSPGIVDDVHDTGGQHSTGTVLDRACPAITAGAAGRAHFRVREIVHTSGFGKGRRRGLDVPSPAIMAGGLAIMAGGLAGSGRDQVLLKGYAIASEARRLKPGEVSRKYLNLIRARSDAPSPAVTASAGASAGVAGVVHPDGTRKFTIDELKLVCSFPADFVLTGTYSQQWERLGRAVPPLMMRAVAERVRDALCAE